MRPPFVLFHTFYHFRGHYVKKTVYVIILAVMINFQEGK